MKVDITNFTENLDEEVDIYSFHNSLTEEETKELRFVTDSFSKYFISIVKMNPTGDIKVREIIHNFDITLGSLLKGFSGTSFSTKVTDHYRNLPTIKTLLEQEETELLNKIKNLEKEVAKLKKTNDLLDSENILLKEELKTLKATKTKPSTTPSAGSYSSYGSCGGGIRYGRC